MVAHWPHVGCAYAGLVIVGQALHGWPDDFEPSTFQLPEKRAETLLAIKRRGTDQSEPMGWLATSPVRGSPFWSVARQVTEALQPGASPWFSGFAWANLYPLAPERENPGGELRAVQDPHVGPLIAAMADMVKARVVIALVGPYWWAASSHFRDLVPRPRPLLVSGVVDGTAWLVGWHPAGASRRGFPPRAYSEILVSEARRLRPEEV